MSIESSMAIQRSKSLLAQMPAWVDRRTVTNSQSGKTIHLRFHCPCGGPNKVSQSVYVGGEKDVAKLAAKLSEKVQEKHGLHNHASLSPRRIRRCNSWRMRCAPRNAKLQSPRTR